MRVELIGITKIDYPRLFVVCPKYQEILTQDGKLYTEAGAWDKLKIGPPLDALIVIEADMEIYKELMLLGYMPESMLSIQHALYIFSTHRWVQFCVDTMKVGNNKHILEIGTLVYKQLLPYARELFSEYRVLKQGDVLIMEKI